MASEWYVQHGGKQYGPMSAANLKKLAAERKITPATQVRSGADGAWVQAAQVKGLFAPPAEAAPKPAATASSGAPQIPKAAPTPPTRAVPRADPLAPPLVTPTAAAVGGAMAPPPWARSAQAPQAAADSPAMAGKILGAVAIILGAVAIATFWLPVLRSPVGWTGIVVGGLGLVVGILGLVVAGMSKGSGLILNVAGTSGSAVGLVLAVVLGVTFGLFSSAPEPPPRVVVERPALPPVEVPKEEPPPPKQPEPEPEPVWTDAGQPIEQPPISARVTGVAIEQLRLESTDLSTLRRQKPQPMLKIRVTIANTSSDKIVEVPGWIGGGDLVGQGVAEILGGDAGKAVKAVSASATLTDNVGNPYKQTPMLSVFGAKIPLGEDYALRPGQTRQAELVFPPPLESVEYLRLELSAAGFSGSDALRFQIPRSMITGMPAPAGG